MTRTALLGLSLIVILLAAGLASAQVATGTPAFGSFGGGPFDTVNLGNLNTHFSVPIVHKPGRGMNFTYDLDYESSIWKPVGISGSQTWQPAFNWGWVPNWAGGSAGYLSYGTTYSDCFIWQVNVWLTNGVQTDSGFVYRDPWGSSHSFSGYVTYDQCAGTTTNTLPSAASDDSGLTLTTTYQIKTSSGEVITPLYNPSGSSQATTVTDANGNKITSNTGGTFTDTLGTTALSITGNGTPSSPVLLTYTSPTGSPHVTVNYTSYNIKTNFNCSGISDYNGTNIPLVSSIVLPDGSQYAFQYETTLGPGNSGYKTGRLSSVTLPTGGTITYAYSGGSGDLNHNAINCSDGSVPKLTRTLSPGGQWTYARTQIAGNHWQTKITTPPDPTVGNDTVIDFAKDSATTNPTNNFYETQRLSYQGSSTSGTLLSTVITCYNGNTTPSSCSSTAVSTPISRTTAFRYLPDVNGLQAKTDSYFDSFGLVLLVSEYDYASGAVGPQVRQTSISYYGGMSNGIVDQPYQVITYDGSSNIKAQTTYNYDESTPAATSGTPQHIAISGSRGNVTTVATQTNSSGATLYRHFSYYDTGTLKTSTDVNGAVTTYNYPDATSTCGNSFPTSVTLPISGLSTSTTWDCNGGVAKTSTDLNGKTTTTAYTDPSFWRPASVTDPTSAVTNFIYRTSNQGRVESYMLFNSNNSSIAEQMTSVDGFGRPVVSQQQTAPACCNFQTTELDYDVFGRPARSTMPYLTSTYGGTNPSAPATTTTYDALGRVLQTTDGGGGYVNNTYSKNDVLQVTGPASSGENTKQKQFEYDALGRLTSVCEITTLAGSSTCGQTNTQYGYWTKYAYDTTTINNLVYNRTTVTQNAQSGAPQMRTYIYDQLGRLISEANPENGTTQYFYDGSPATPGYACASNSAGDLVKSYDANGNTICYAYDSLHRLVQKFDVGPNSQNLSNYYTYDSATVNGVVMSNAKGRMAEAYTATCYSCTKLTELGFSYSVRGELTDTYEYTPHSGGYYHVAAAYWANGAVSSLSSNISGLPSQTYAVDPMGRTAAVTASSGQNPVTSTNYNLSAFTTSVTFGSGDSDTFYLDPNTGRQTKYVFNLNGVTNTGQTNWNQNGSLGSMQITDNIGGTSDTQTCTFTHDELARVASTNCLNGATNKWNQAFTYDAFGNIKKATNGPGISFQPLYTGAETSTSPANQFYQIGSGPTGASHYQDANGRVIYDGAHNYTWDSEGKMVAVDTTTTITYDAQGRMVEKAVGGVYTQIVYGPQGRFATMTGQTLVQALVPLPAGATAVYTSSGLAYYRHQDHLGSSRLATTPSRTLYSSTAYAPFGEEYAQAGTTDLSFTGQGQDTISGMYDFLMRKYPAVQGRWLSPDPAGLAAVNFGNPQSWNRYGYVGNSPLNATDPLGLVTNNPPTPLPPNPGPTPPSAPPDPGTASGCTMLTVAFGYCTNAAALEAFRQAIANAGWDAAKYHATPDQLARQGAANNGTCGKTWYPRSAGLSYGASGDAGAGYQGVTATGSAGGGIFYNGNTGLSGGGFAGGGATAYFFNGNVGAPKQQGQPFNFGGYAGVGPSVWISNAGGAPQLGGPFTTLSLNVGAGPAKFSLQLSYGGGIWQLSVGPPVPYVSAGTPSISVSKLTTVTTTTSGCH